MKIIGFLCLLLISGGSGKQADFGGSDYDYSEFDDAENGEIPQEVGGHTEGELPMFNQMSQEIVVKEGETITMDCRIKKPTEHMLIIQRYKQLIFVGQMKVLKTSKMVSKDQVFVVANAQRSDSGNYHCFYQTKPVVKITFKVDVQYQSSVFSKTPKIQNVDKGATVTVKCQANGNPDPIISWSKNNGRLPSGAMSEEGVSLTMENVDRHVEGTYVCTANNGVGEAASIAMKILVEYPPEIITEKAIVRTGNGDIVELVCIVHARPVASVTWSKDGASLVPDPDLKEIEGGHRHALTISNITEDKFGAYKCTAQNMEGSTSAEISLTDAPKKPHFTSPSMSAVETTYTLAWDTESFYPITEYTVKYRLVKANDTTDVPGEWHEESLSASEEDMVKNDLVHRMKHNLENLLPATDYEAVVVVKNKLKEAEKATFNFSTRKAVITTSLHQENVQYSVEEEMVGSRTTVGSSDIQRLNAAILFAASVCLFLVS